MHYELREGDEFYSGWISSDKIVVRCLTIDKVFYNKNKVYGIMPKEVDFLILFKNVFSSYYDAYMDTAVNYMETLQNDIKESRSKIESENKKISKLNKRINSTLKCLKSMI